MEFKKFGEMSKEKIKWLEQKYRVTFPNDYKQFLLGNNGGFFNIENMNKVPVDELNDNIYMEVLYGCDTPYDVTNIEYWMDEYESELIEESIIIGNDLSQGFLVLILLEGYEGVYFWDDGHNFESSTDEENTYFIAETFTNFLKKIQYE
ncbi:SMI1/KNR4 family protein [Staphylococcus sp. HMSC065D05]|uniref:SMI1/KNR4 family protein n=1 Tax=Staphylococcus sp. HMSC065D05 TaxID=1739401 RepID=UPI0008A10C93|nr:SMI1/KNR4 family protein [Staphylococcus sp. HMSC065D05]OFR28007.1 1,3-beta-glucan synthase regulator [Staphylococcus sp. HMSC065D05]